MRKKNTSTHIASANMGPNVLYIPGDCYLHAFHSAVKDSLALTDRILAEWFDPSILDHFRKYFTSVGSVCSAWRLLAKDVMQVWEQIHLEEGADFDVQRLCHRYPLAVVAGRWGSIEKAEEYLLQRGKRGVVKTMMQVLSSHMKADTDPGDLDLDSDFKLRLRLDFNLES